MNISVVIPLLNEEESIKELYLWIAKVMQANSFSYEVIFIDDGSTDTSWSIIDSLHKQHPQIKAIQFLRNFGKSQALHAGFAMAQGDVIITMDADLQDNPEEIPLLYNMILWLSITPFGLPVVPEVYIRVAKSSSCTASIRFCTSCCRS